MKFWVTDKDEIITFTDFKEHYEVAEENGLSYGGATTDKNYPDALESGWIRGTLHGNELSFEGMDIEDNFRRISDIIDKIPNSAKAEVISIDDQGGDYRQIPREMVDKMGLERAYYKVKQSPTKMYASKKEDLLDEIQLGNWNIVKEWVTSLQTELSPSEFEKTYGPLSIAIELVNEMGKDGLNLAKEYADKIFSGETEKESVFQDGVYTLDRNKTGVPFDMEPVSKSGPYPRGLVPIQKGVGDIAPIDRVSAKKVTNGGWITDTGKFIPLYDYMDTHEDVASEQGFDEGVAGAFKAGWIRVVFAALGRGTKIYFHGKKFAGDIERIEQFLRKNPETAGKTVHIDLSDRLFGPFDAEDILKYGLQNLIKKEERKVKSFSLFDLTADFQKEPTWKGWMPPKEPMELYHATAVDNMDSIRSKGLMPFGETTEIRKPAVWMSDKPDFAINHFKNRFPGKKGVLLKLLVDPEVVGIHQSMIGYPNVFVCHENIPANMIVEEIPVENKVSFSLDYITRVASALRAHSQRTGDVLDNLRPLATLWYENEDGDKYIPTDEDMMKDYPAENSHPEEYIYQHYRGPVLEDSITMPNAPELARGTTGLNCIEPIVIALVQDKGWDWVDALVFAASTCERCLNILLEETTGEIYDGRDSAGTWCECCEMIDPEYDNHYKTVVQPEIDRDIKEDSHFSCVGFKDLKAYSGKYKKVWIDPSDKIIEFDIVFAHAEIIKKFLPNSDRYKTSDDAYEAAIKDGWIRKGETPSLLYFFVNDLNDLSINRLQKYIDSDPSSLIDKETVDIDYGTQGHDNEYVSAEDVEKYGLKSAIQRSKRQPVHGFKELVASSEYNKAWITNKDEVLDIDDVAPNHYMYLEDMNLFFNDYGKNRVILAVENDWIRKGETDDELYFSVNKLDNKTISRLEKYIDHNPSSLDGKDVVYIDSTDDSKSVMVYDVEKYGLSRAIKRRKLVNAFTLADLIRCADGGGSESLMLTPRNTDLAPQSDWRYPIRQETNPTGFRPFMTDSPPGPKLKETTEDSRIFFFGPSFNQHLTKIKKEKKD